MVYIVIFDVIEPSTKYDRLICLIKSELAWAKLTRFSFLIDSDESTVALRDKFKTVLDNTDKLYVGVAKAPAAWVGMSENVSNWIKSNLEE